MDSSLKQPLQVCADPTTQFPFPASIMGTLEQMLYSNLSLAAIIINIHGLDPIEETHGHEAFDKILREMAKNMEGMKGSLIRKDDQLASICAGGPSFVIFLSEKREEKKTTRHLIKEDIEHIALRVHSYLYPKLCSLFFEFTHENPKLAIGQSLVVYNPLIRPKRLIYRLMEEAQQMARLHLPLSKIKNKEDLQTIILEERISTVFQPIVFLDSKIPMGYEALTRGPLGTTFESPLTLFSLAKEVGLIFELDRLCRHRALVETKVLPKEAKIFINTLPTTIHDPEFRGSLLAEFLAQIGRKPEHIVFEINERVAIDSFEAFKRATKQYTDIGISIAIDDAGTGYSSLEAIVELKPQYLKFDMSMVKGISQNTLKQEMLKVLMPLAERLNASVIAEGIENEEDLEVLQKMGVTLGQGYLFSRPKPASEFSSNKLIS